VHTVDCVSHLWPHFQSMPDDLGILNKLFLEILDGSHVSKEVFFISVNWFNLSDVLIQTM